MAERGCLWIAGVFTAYMLIVVAFNVVARMLFDATGAALNLMIPGAIEQASYALIVIVLAAIAASMRGGMITVDLFTGRLPRRGQRALTRVWYLVMVVFALVLARAFGGETATLLARGDVTQDLGMPLWTVYAVVTAETLALALVCLGHGLGAVAGDPAGPADDGKAGAAAYRDTLA